MHLTINELLDYTDEERAKWQSWFTNRGNDPLRIRLVGDTHSTVGALILHCFWAEAFYAYWMHGEVLTNESAIVKQNKDLPVDDAEAIFTFGQSTRQTMRSFTTGATEVDWERVREVKTEGIHIRGSARQLIDHILVHEIRHLAQVAIIVREHGLPPPGDHDLLFSQSFGTFVSRT